MSAKDMEFLLKHKMNRQSLTLKMISVRIETIHLVGLQKFKILKHIYIVPCILRARGE